MQGWGAVLGWAKPPERLAAWDLSGTLHPAACLLPESPLWGVWKQGQGHEHQSPWGLVLALSDSGGSERCLSGICGHR